MLLLSLIQFRVGWPEGVTIHSQDFNIGVLAIYDRIFPQDWFTGSWQSSGLLGSVATRFLNLTNILLVLMPVEAAADFVYPLLLTIAAAGVFTFLWRDTGHLPASLTGALVVAWFGTGAVFALNAVSYLGVIWVLVRWRRGAAVSDLPAERFFSAMRTGVRFARHSPELGSAVIRGVSSSCLPAPAGRCCPSSPAAWSTEGRRPSASWSQHSAPAP